uniref:Uncharacterized protein n=1 Tax=Cacopsylla melanoneura TaxID=428564 RepID=A0A8D8V4E4_9HEMI
MTHHTHHTHSTLTRLTIDLKYFKHMGKIFVPLPNVIDKQNEINQDQKSVPYKINKNQKSTPRNNSNLTKHSKTDQRQKSKSIRIFYQNTRGLKTKTDNFLLSLMSEDYDIVAIVESWLSPDINTSELFDDRYEVYRQDRCEGTSTKKKALS